MYVRLYSLVLRRWRLGDGESRSHTGTRTYFFADLEHVFYCIQASREALRISEVLLRFDQHSVRLWIDQVLNEWMGRLPSINRPEINPVAVTRQMHSRQVPGSAH